MLYRSHHLMFAPWSNSQPHPVVFSLFLFNPATDSHERLAQIEERFPQIRAVYRKSHQVLLFTAEEQDKFMWTMVEVGPRGLSAATDTIVKGGGPLTTEAVSLVQTHVRMDAMKALTSLRQMKHLVGKGRRDLYLASRLQQDAQQRLAADGAALVEAFCQHLDPDILKVMEGSDSLWYQEVYNWIALSKDKRIRAVQDYPHIAPHFMEIDKTSCFELSALLDLGGGSLEEFLCEQLRIRRVTFRHINSLPDDLFEELNMRAELEEQLGRFDSVYKIRNYRYPYRAVSLVALLDALPVHLFPSLVEDWKMLDKIAKDIFSLTKRAEELEAGGLPALDRYLADVVQNYGRYVASTSSSGQMLYQEDVYHVQDAVHSFVEMVIMPSVAATGMVRKNLYPSKPDTGAFRRLTGHVMDVFTAQGVKDLYNFSRLWHERGASNRLTGGSDPTAKEGLLLPYVIEEPWTSPEGYRFEPLLRYRDVGKEGAEMRHCLAGYADSCLRGEILAFRVFGPHNFRATTTVRIAKGPQIFEYHGIEFFANGWIYDENGKRVRREEAPMSVAMQLVDYLNSKAKEVRQSEETRRYLATTAGWHTYILDEPDIALEIAERNFQVFLPLLPRRLRAATAAELIVGPFLEGVLPIMKKAWRQERARAAYLELELAA